MSFLSSVTKNEKDGDLFWRTIVVVFLILFMLLSFLFLLTFWEKNASKADFVGVPQYELVNGTRVVTQKETIMIDNYYPLLSREITPYIEKTTDYGANKTTKILEDIMETYKAENITIDQWTWKSYYGDAQTSTPLTQIHPASFATINTPGMSENVITITWTYQTSANYTTPYVQYMLKYSTTKVNDLSASPLLRTLQFSIPPEYRELVLGIIFFNSWCLAGFLLAYGIFWRKADIKKAYCYLRKFNYGKPQDKENIDELSDNLKTLKYVSTRLSIFTRLALGLSLLIFKVHFTSLVKKHRDECTLREREKFEKEFCGYAEISESKFSDFIPERQTILVIIGFLASLGISFSFNLGALAPFIYSIGIMYLFLNIGSTFCLMGKTRDFFWPLLFFVIAVLVVSSQSLLILLR